MRLAILQNVSFENEGAIEDWVRTRKAESKHYRLYEHDTLPTLAEFDCLVIMGGPMNIYEEDQYPFLKIEKALIKEAITAHKKVIGICLGAQLIADVLKAPVTKNHYKEIGWFPLSITPRAAKNKYFDHFPPKLLAFHWHGDTFEIPNGALPLFSSEACKHQGFLYGENVAAFQFHLEVTAKNIGNLLNHCENELVEGKYIQSADQIRENVKYCILLNEILHQFLDQFLSAI